MENRSINQMDAASIGSAKPFNPKESEADIARRKADADASYRRAGIEPPNWQPEQIPVTLQMMLLAGWRIEQDQDGVKVLVSPRKDVGS